MSEEIVYMFDAYMKKSILNCVKRYEKYIDYEISTYGIDNVVDCKDEIINKAKQIIAKEKQKQKFNTEHN